MKLKNVLLTGLSFVLVVAVAIGGTLAYLTSTDDDVNVMTLGNVKIEQHEQDRDGNDFVQGQTLLPYVTLGATQKEPVTVNGYEIQMRTKESVGNYMDKIVTVTNTGKTDAYVRTLIAIPAALENADASKNIIHWNAVSDTDTTPNNGWMWDIDNGNEWGAPVYATIEVEGVKYNVYVATNKNIIKAGESTAPSLVGIYLDSKVDSDGDKYTYDGQPIDYDFSNGVTILVMSQAVQAAGFADADTALDTAFGEITSTNNPWANVTIATEVGITGAGTYELKDDVYTIDSAYFHTQKVTAPVTINGNGATVEGVATSVDAFQWEGGTIPAMSAIFSSANGSKVTVNDLKFTGTMSAIMLGHYQNATYNNYNTELNNVDVIGTEVVSFSSNTAPAVCVYGTAVLNNCNVYGTKLSALDTDPMWPVYDVAAVNYTDLTVNNSKIGSLLMWNQAKVTVAEDTELDTIVVRGNMNTTKYGLTIKAGATVDVIDLSAITNKAKINITIEDGSTVGKIVANGVEYATLTDWQNA